MGWTNPKTDWSAGDGIRASDLNRIEENIRVSYQDVFDLSGFYTTLTPYDHTQSTLVDPNNPIELTATTIRVPTGKNLRLYKVSIAFRSYYATNDLSNFSGVKIATGRFVNPIDRWEEKIAGTAEENRLWGQFQQDYYVSSNVNHMPLIATGEPTESMLYVSVFFIPPGNRLVSSGVTVYRFRGHFAFSAKLVLTDG